MARRKKAGRARKPARPVRAARRPEPWDERQPTGEPSLEDEGLVYPGTAQAEGERRPEDDLPVPA